MIRRWNVVLTAQRPFQDAAVMAMSTSPVRRLAKPAPTATKKRIIRPSTFIAAQLSLSA